MKSLSRSVLAALFLVSGLSLSGFAAPQNAVSLDLSGVVLKSGVNQVRNSLPGSIVRAKQYDYSITGTCHGTGLFATDVPPGTSIADEVDEIQPGSSAILTGTVFDLPKTFPLSLIHRSVHGSHAAAFGFTVSGAATIRVGIGQTGVAGMAVSGVRFAINGHVDRNDSIVLDPGAKCDVTVTTPPSLTPHPDALLLLNAHVGIGNDLYNTDGTGQTLGAKVSRGASKTFFVLIENDAQAADGFTVHGDASTPGFAVRYFVGQTNVTAAVVAGTYSFPSVASGDLRLLRAVVTATGAAPHGAVKDVLVTTTSTTLLIAQDAVKAHLLVR